MNQQKLIEAEVPIEKFDLLSREELIQFARLEQQYRLKLEKEVKRLRALNGELEQRTLLLQDQHVIIKNKLFGKSSEKLPTKAADDSLLMPPSDIKKTKFKRVLLPSERYPDAALIEREIMLEQMPDCRCCGTKMQDSGLTEDSEFLTIIPEQYLVIRQKRHKYRCSKCHGDLQTAPAPPRIKEGSTYSDEMIIDVSLTKYCDLVPIERYSSIAARSGLQDLPPHSLIESTHYLSEFVSPAYEKLKAEVLSAKVLHADETPHRMLEGDKKSSWFLWGFSAPGVASFFECHSTRSGDVAAKLLFDSSCEFLVSDVFSGYGKAVRETNGHRETQGRTKIQSVFCNAHARRRFKEAADRFADDANFFLNIYQKIYLIEAELKDKPPDEALQIRQKQILPLFLSMKNRAIELWPQLSEKSSLSRALSYFVENWQGLTLFLSHAQLPIDNNPQERLLRNPVIGRKTWYGTHSKRGAKTSAVLFSLVESCKMNGVNPRVYFKKLVADLHAGKPAYTPNQFKNQSLPVNAG